MCLIQKVKKRSFESLHREWVETQAVIVGDKNNLIQWELFSITGKSHQLSPELSRRGFPILVYSLYVSKN